MRLWYGFSTLRKLVLVLFGSYLPSRVASPVAASTFICSKTFLTSLESFPCRQRATSFLNPGIPLIRIPSKFSSAEVIVFAVRAISVSDGSAILFWITKVLIWETEFFRSAISFSFFRSWWFCFSFLIPWWVCRAVCHPRMRYTVGGRFPQVL